MDIKTKKQTTGNKGITLIALVITIIVILILAGVSIAMLIGSNGIIEQAVSAEEETQIAILEERIKLIILSSITKSNSLVDEILKEKFDNEFGIGNYELVGMKQSGWKLNVNGKSFIITPSADVYHTKAEISANQVCALLYGTYITNYSCNNDEAINGWRIFYSDKQNIYLIADDYIEYQYIPAKDNVKPKYNPYKTYTLNNEEQHYAIYFDDDFYAKYKGLSDIKDKRVENLSQLYFSNVRKEHEERKLC